MKRTSKIMLVVPLFDLKFLNTPAASDAGTSNRRHQARWRVAEVNSEIATGLGDPAHEPNQRSQR
jgi:hypothetical protein